MERPLTPFGALGQWVATALENDGGARARAIESARRAFVQPAVPRRAWRWHSVAKLAPAVAVAIIAVAGGLAHSGRSAPLTFDVNGQPGAAQSWLSAPSQAPLAVRFSDGTVLDLAASTRARVEKTGPRGASIALESGSLQARVVHRPESAWSVTAGPFVVRVTGTRFDLSWVAATQTFSLDVRDGSVVVLGASIGFERPVVAGQKLIASVNEGRFEVLTTMVGEQVRSASPSQAAAADASADSAASTIGSAVPKVVGAVSAASGRSPQGLPDWKELARRGDLKAAYRAAEAIGFSGLCETASASELLLLGDAARLSHRSVHANEALLALRRRYPSDPRRAAAAFALGKVAFDQRRAYGEAAQWFRTSMQEAPAGPLAREAAGRRIEALRSAGDTAAMREAARDYLLRYSDGPHAEVARAVVVE